MADVAAADVTAVVNERHYMGRGGYISEATITVAAAGTKTYPAGGIPGITPALVGFRRVIKTLKIIESDVSGYQFDWDISAGKLRMLIESITTGATAIAANENGALVTASNAVEQAAPRFPKTAASTSYNIGKMAELGNLVFATLALRAECRGY